MKKTHAKTAAIVFNWFCVYMSPHQKLFPDSNTTKSLIKLAKCISTPLSTRYLLNFHIDEPSIYHTHKYDNRYVHGLVRPVNQRSRSNNWGSSNCQAICLIMSIWSATRGNLHVVYCVHVVCLYKHGIQTMSKMLCIFPFESLINC